MQRSNIAVFTLTRDRLDYTKHCFALLREKACCAFDHYVLDNGSQDGTPEWLEQEYKPFWKLLLPENIGIAKAANIVLRAIFPVVTACPYRYIVKFDNDCEIISDGILRRMVACADELPFTQLYALSPRVEGIRTRVARKYVTDFRGSDSEMYRIGVTSLIGGLFHLVPAALYRSYRYNESLPKAWGNDGDFCRWLHKMEAGCGYVENLQVNHYETTDGQKLRYPEYFARKALEEVTP